MTETQEKRVDEKALKMENTPVFDSIAHELFDKTKRALISKYYESDDLKLAAPHGPVLKHYSFDVWYDLYNNLNPDLILTVFVLEGSDPICVTVVIESSEKHELGRFDVSTGADLTGVVGEIVRTAESLKNGLDGSPCSQDFF